MPKIKEVLVAAMLPAIKLVGKAELEAVLSGIQSHNTDDIYRNTLQGLYSNFLLLKQVAVKSKTKVDDGLIDLVLEAVQESADASGIVLS